MSDKNKISLHIFLAIVLIIIGIFGEVLKSGVL